MYLRLLITEEISNNGKQYCYASVFRDPLTNREIFVYTDLNKASDRFVVTSRNHCDGGQK